MMAIRCRRISETRRSAVAHQCHCLCIALIRAEREERVEALERGRELAQFGVDARELEVRLVELLNGEDLPEAVLGPRELARGESNRGTLEQGREVVGRAGEDVVVDLERGDGAASR